MKQLTNYIAAIACIVLCTTANAQKQTPPAGTKAKDFKLSEKSKEKHANGLQTTFVQYGDLPKVNISLMVKTGNVHEGSSEVWLSDLTGEMLREGTSKINFADRTTFKSFGSL